MTKQKETHRVSRTPSWRGIFLMWLGWIVLVNVLLWAGHHRFPSLGKDTSFPWIGEWTVERRNVEDGFWQLHARWDGEWYRQIVERGYHYSPSEMSNIAFFPLYPAAIFLVSRIVPDVLAAGVVVSSIAFLGVLLLLDRLFRLDGDESDSRRGLWYLMIFPSAFFFGMVYTESLFLLTAISAMLAARKQRWAMAGMAAAAATLLRSPGILLLPAILIEYWISERRLSPRVLWLFLPLLALLGWFGYHWLTFGDFFAFFRTEGVWGRSIGSFEAEHFIIQTIPAGIRLAFDAAVTAVAIALSFAVGRIRFSYAIYSLGVLVLPLATGTLMSMNRFALAAFPIFLVLARFGRRELFDRLWTLGCALFLALSIMLFANYYWAG